MYVCKYVKKIISNQPLLSLLNYILHLYATCHLSNKEQLSFLAVSNSPLLSLLAMVVASESPVQGLPYTT